MNRIELWERRSVVRVGGLTEIGFVIDTNHVLVVSHQGRGLVDCVTGELIARDPDADPQGWFDESRPAALGLGQSEGLWVDVWGLAGGEGSTSTETGWTATRQGDDVVLEGPSGSQRLSAGIMELRAFGFSPNDQYFVLATPADLSIFALAQSQSG